MKNSYIDTHCHINMVLDKKELTSFSSLKQEFPENFEKAITISCDPHSIDITTELLGNKELYGAFGIHPHDAKKYTDSLEEQLVEAIQHTKTVAWGEIGLDYFYEYSDVETQKKIFIRQIQNAISYNKPIIVHTREAEEDTLNIMKKHIPKDWNIHVHCFTSSISLAKQLLNHFSNLYLGFTGIITFKNAKDVQETAYYCPLNRLLLETDAPYLAPTPHRGSIAHSGHIPFITEKIATLKEISLEQVYEQCRENTKHMYSI